MFNFHKVLVERIQVGFLDHSHPTYDFSGRWMSCCVSRALRTNRPLRQNIQFGKQVEKT
jgi:hypothetical protein